MSGDPIINYIKYKDLDVPQANKGAFWEQIKWLLALMYKNYGDEMMDLEMSARVRRDAGLSGMNEGVGRAQGVVPPRLNGWLVHVYPNEEMLPYKSRGEMWQQFFKKFPQFSYRK